MIKVSDNWFEKYYDQFLAKTTLSSKFMNANAVKEVAFLKKLYNFQNDQTVLDIPCGTGRHSLRLARLGLNVTGLDISPACIAECKKGITKQIKKRVKFKQADIRDLSGYHSQYDYVINMCTSLGYFSTARENQKALRQMVKCLTPGGQLFIQNINRDWLLSRFEPIDWVETDEYFLLSKREYNSRTNYIVNDWIYILKRTGEVKRYPHRLKLYSRTELSQMMTIAGLSKIRVFGDLNEGKLVKDKSRWMYLTGKKA